MNKDNLHDSNLILLKISQGDLKAFNALFEQYRNPLFTYLFKITKSAETSEEIVLDVFLKIWHGKELILQIENFDGEIKANLVEYLYIVDHRGNCQPQFSKDTPQFLLEFLQTAYSSCHNYMADHPDKIVD